MQFLERLCSVGSLADFLLACQVVTTFGKNNCSVPYCIGTKYRLDGQCWCEEMTRLVQMLIDSLNVGRACSAYFVCLNTMEN